MSSSLDLEEAHKRIEECRRTGEKKLDLSLLSLTEIPKEVSKLTWLSYLDIDENELTNLDSLKHVPQLESLSCTNPSLSNFYGLKFTPGLKSLRCRYSNELDLKLLKHIKNLHSLDIREGNIFNIENFKYTPSLKFLDYTGNGAGDLSFLKHIKKLKTLFLYGAGLSSTKGLKHTPDLLSLDIGFTFLEDIDEIQLPQKLLYLNISMTLNYFGYMDELKFLEACNQLQVLDCSVNGINELSTLKKIPNLQKLIANSNNLSDLEFIYYLKKLKFLDCANNKITDLKPLYFPLISKKIKHLKLAGNPVDELPPALFKSEHEDCSENLRNYWLDIKEGCQNRHRLKIQLIGNGRTGKTTLTYALKYKKGPKKNFKPTHGITTQNMLIKPGSSGEPVNLQLWDFGGQEIYHATHRLFLGDDCLYLLLWAEETEEHPDETNHPVSYWLELIHDLAPNSPVILIKNQIDRSDKQSARPHELADDELPGVKQIRQDVKISAKKYQRMNSLRGAIEDVLEELQHRVCLTLPKSWIEIENKLKTLNTETVPFEQFHQLCVEAKINDPEWFADYLHKTGFLFYQKGAFQDQIILDQNWAITATYRLFDPKGSKPIVEGMNGRFFGSMANVFWPESSETEHQIYLSFMHNCGICYEPDRYENHHKPFAERKFIVPALLPKQCSAQSAWNKQPNDWQLDIEYNFLHRSIIERLILRLDETYTGEPWRNGIFCTTEFGKLLLEHNPSVEEGGTARKRISCHLRTDEQPAQLLYALRKLVKDVSPHQRYREYLLKGEEERQPLEAFKEKDNNVPSQLDEQPPAKTVRLFISYSRTDREHKLTLEKYLRIVKDSLKFKVNFIVWSDNSMDAGEGVNEQIMPELKRADIIVLLTSPDFFDPDRYSCREELPIALHRYEEEGIPVIPVVLRHTSVWAEKVGHLTIATEENALPLEDWPSADKYWDSVATGIRGQVEKLAGLE